MGPENHHQPVLRAIGLRDVQCGSNVVIMQPSNLYGCVLGDDCFVGPFVEIQNEVVIGRRGRIQSHAFVCELVRMGDDCTVSHGVMFVNDPYRCGGPARRNRDLWRPTVLGNHVSIGANATILPVTICDHVVIGAGAVVTKDIVLPGIYAGNPARFLRAIERSGHAAE